MIYVLSPQRFAKESLSVLPAGGLRAAGRKAKMEAGANPARSRHCIDGALLMNPLNRRVWEGKRGVEV